MKTAKVISTKSRLPGASRVRRGFQTLELVFVLPVLILLLLAALEYGRVLTTRSGVIQAVTVAAREAGKGGNILDVTEAVNRVLAAHHVAITDVSGSGTKLLIQDGSGAISEFGDPNLSLPQPPAIGPDEVCVTLCIEIDAKRTDGRRSIIPSLDVLGFSRSGKHLSTRAVVKKEDRRV